MSVSKERQDLISFQLSFQSNDLEFTAMLLFSSQCVIAHVKMSDKLEASFDAWRKKMFSIPSTHNFSEYFFHILLGVLISHYFSFDLKDGEKKNLQDFSIIYHRRHLRPDFKVDFCSHSCTLGSWSDLLGEELSEAEGMNVRSRTSDTLTQPSVFKLGHWNQCSGRGY